MELYSLIPYKGVLLILRWKQQCIHKAGDNSGEGCITSSTDWIYDLLIMIERKSRKAGHPARYFR